MSENTPFYKVESYVSVTDVAVSIIPQAYDLLWYSFKLYPDSF